MRVTNEWYRNYLNRRGTSGAKPKPAVCDERVGEAAGKEEHAGRFHVGVISFRCRLCDPDNLCPKYFIDCLRYAGVIPDDTSAHIDLSISQTKVAHRSEEKPQIVVLKV